MRGEAPVGGVKIKNMSQKRVFEEGKSRGEESHLEETQAVMGDEM